MTAAAQDAGPRLPVPEIEELARAALAGNGFSEANARAVARCVAEAERDGAASHGLARVPTYIASVASGRVAGQARPALKERRGPHLVVDAGMGFTAPAVMLARRAIAETAREHGMALASFRDSHHLHALWWDVEPLAEEGLLAIAVVAARPVMAVFGGTGRALGTNPFALSAPRRDTHPLTIDMTASATARGEIGLAARAGRAIPAGWALDSRGRPTTDAQEALEGTQLPFSEGPKAAALALAVELMAVGLSGGRFGFEALREPRDDGGPLRTGSIILAFDPSGLGAPRFAERVDELTRHLREAGATRLPGDRRHACRAGNSREGVRVDPALADELARLARA
jgi:LDH2 family malate/lactate/ureidoglycolate dehydrogenase